LASVSALAVAARRTRKRTEDTMENSTTRLRGMLLVAALLCLAAGLWWAVSPLLFDIEDGDVRLVPVRLLPTYWILFPLGDDSDGYPGTLALFLGTLLLTEWMFLRPRKGWKIRMVETGRPLKTAVAAAAFMAMMLTFGAFAVLAELLGFWNQLLDDDSWKLLMGANLVLWLLWALIFHFRFRNGTRLEQLEAMARGLITGSLLELVVAAGVFVWKTDEEDCYCARGSYVGLVFAGTVLLWAFGPGLVFLFLREARYRRKARQS
jgi:hypothetical protein